MMITDTTAKKEPILKFLQPANSKNKAPVKAINNPVRAIIVAVMDNTIKTNINRINLVPFVLRI